MVTIKYVWLYAAIFLAGAGGYGAAYFADPNGFDLERQLLAAQMQIEELKKHCPANAMKRVPLKKSRGEEF